MTPPTHHATASVQTPLTEEEMRALEAVRRRFYLDHGLLSVSERAHLHFLRWLLQTGRLVP